MARYNESAKILANLVRDKNRLKAEIAGATDIISITRRLVSPLKIELYNLVIKTRTLPATQLWDGSTWGGCTWEPDGTFSEVSRRKWVWDTTSRLEEGSKSANIDISNGDVRLV